jgi:predicted metal-dependent peptidase
MRRVSRDAERTSEEALRIEQIESAKRTGENALRMVAVNLPWLSPLVYAITLLVDDRVRVAAVTKSGKVLLNPQIFADLPLNEATFVIAHELMHLALDTFSRESSFDDPDTVNRAHDYIINDLLVTELNMAVPLQGLYLYGASQWSLEKVVAWMNADEEVGKPPCWYWDPPRPQVQDESPGILATALRNAGIVPEPEAEGDADEGDGAGSPQFSLDVIFPQMEREWFPDATELNVSFPSIEAAIRQVVSLKHITDVGQVHLRGTQGGSQSHYIQALKSFCRPPWEAGLQRWLEAMAPGQRTYARPSRRGAANHDFVLAGKQRDGWTLHIILDTSGSMSDELSRCLGAIADFCEAVGVAEVHILQCDTRVTVDEWVAIENLDQYRIAGFGGSNMSPAMNHLNLDSEVQAAIVITDGCIGYPEKSPAYEVLWVLTGGYSFAPPYGSVLKVNPTAGGRL